MILGGWYSRGISLAVGWSVHRLWAVATWARHLGPCEELYTQVAVPCEWQCSSWLSLLSFCYICVLTLCTLHSYCFSLLHSFFSLFLVLLFSCRSSGIYYVMCKMCMMNQTKVNCFVKKTAAGIVQHHTGSCIPLFSLLKKIIILYSQLDYIFTNESLLLIFYVQGVTWYLICNWVYLTCKSFLFKIYTDPRDQLIFYKLINVMIGN